MPPESRAPLLLPQNRKLRHLEGVWLRNLSFPRPQSRTTDDVALNTSTNKLDTLRETPKLHHALSSGSLRAKARRRSTTLSNESLLPEHKRLQAMYDSCVADVFFSLHCDDEEEPVYISEKQDRKTNFNFLPFDLKHHGADVARSPIVTVKIWTKRPIGAKEWFLHQAEDIDLRRLNFLGTVFNHRHPPNSLVFHLSDGVYSLDVPGKDVQPKELPSLPTSSYNALMKLATLETSIHDALATRERVTNQINSIIENTPKNEAPQAEQRVDLAKKYVSQQSRSVRAAQRRRDELRASIQARQEAIQAGCEAQDKAETDVANARDKLAHSKVCLGQTEEQIRGQRRRICCDLADIFPITPAPSGQPLSFQICGLALPNTTYDTATSRPRDDDRLSAALGHAALLTHHLHLYLGVALPYPISQYGSRSTIRDDISLFADAPRHATSSAPRSSFLIAGSGSARAATANGKSHGHGDTDDDTDTDSLNPAREFPLYLPRGGSTAAHFRFDYAWFLLNKDIEVLCSSQALRVVDIRHTLPNLKYLLYVCSAGSEEIPQRKRGGVRGLWAGRLKGRMTMPEDDDGDAGSSVFGVGSRRGSVDSVAVAKRGDELRRAATGGGEGEGIGSGGGEGGGADRPGGEAGGRAGTGDDSLGDLGSLDGLSFAGDDMKVTLRTKAFTENAGK